MEIRQIGRYQIQRRLGKGGMGSLYLARDPGLDRLVAIKLLKDDYLDDHELRERFSREARALARLRHPNIVVVFDFGEHEGRPFMAMEYIDGETLRQRLARTPPLKPALGVALVEDLCAGLANAHDAGIVHRDIKPDNIMMDRQGVVKLLDFGIARSAHAESTHQMTQPGMIMGTYNYMSPEQLLGEMVDKRSDIFAVGAVLYQVIAREQAFPGAFGAVYHRVLTTGPVPLEQRVPGVDPTLVRIVLRALARDPNDRYQNAIDMRQELSRARLRLAEPGSDAAGARETVVLPRTSSARREKDSEAKRGLVTEQLRLAREAFERGDYDIALQYGERAAFVDPDNEVASELINKSRVAIDARSVLRLLQEATRLLSKGRIQEALSRAEEASAAVPDLLEAADLRKQVQAVLDQVLSAREREDRINTSLERAHQSFDRAEYETALRAVYEVLALDPDRAQARELEQRAKVQLQAQREHERARLDALDRITAARALADEGRFDEATAALNAITPPTDTVRAAVADAMAVVERRSRANTAVADARAAAAEGHFTQAVSIIEAIPSDDLTEDGRKVRSGALESLAQRREMEEKRRRLEQLLISAEALIEASDVTQARGRLAEAAELGLEDHRFGLLSQQLEQLITRVEGQKRKQALDREAAEAEAARLREQQRIAEQQRQEREARERERQHAAAERQRQEHAAGQRERALAEEQQRKELDARQREQRRIIEEEKRLAEEAREREEQLQATVVRPAKQTATALVQAPVSPAPTQWGGKALVAAAALVVVAIGSWVALSLRNGEAPGVTNPPPQVISIPAPPADADKPIPPEPPSPNPQPPNPLPPVSQPPNPAASQNDATSQKRQQLAIADARNAIQAAIERGDLDFTERLLADAQRRFGADNFETQSQALTQLRISKKDAELRASVQGLVEKSKQERDHQTAIGLLNRALQLSPGDSNVQSEIRRRNEALTADARQKDVDERERQRQALEQLQRQEKDRGEGIKNAQAAIDRALAQGDLNGADTLVQDAERQYGVGPFGPLRQQLLLKREQAAAAADTEKVRVQIRAVLDRFAQAYSAKDDAGLAAAWPSVPRASYRTTFNSFESLSWVFGACEIEVAGTSATARCPVTLRRVDVRGRVTSESGRRRFVLRNPGNGWRIEDMQVQ